jgi:hypothetical protein
MSEMSIVDELLEGLGENPTVIETTQETKPANDTAKKTRSGNGKKKATEGGSKTSKTTKDVHGVKLAKLINLRILEAKDIITGGLRLTVPPKSAFVDKPSYGELCELLEATASKAKRGKSKKEEDEEDDEDAVELSIGTSGSGEKKKSSSLPVTVGPGAKQFLVILLKAFAEEMNQVLSDHRLADELDNLVRGLNDRDRFEKTGDVYNFVFGRAGDENLLEAFTIVFSVVSHNTGSEMVDTWMNTNPIPGVKSLADTLTSIVQLGNNVKASTRRYVETVVSKFICFLCVYAFNINWGVKRTIDEWLISSFLMTYASGSISAIEGYRSNIKVAAKSDSKSNFVVLKIKK